MFPVLIIYSKATDDRFLLLKEFTNLIDSHYQVEFLKQVQDIHHFFHIIKEQYKSRIIQNNKKEIQLQFESGGIKNEFINNVKFFYPNPLEKICNDTQHMMKNEPIYSVCKNSTLIGILNDKQQIILGKRVFTPLQFLNFHWNILPDDIRKTDKPNNECKIKRNGELVNFFNVSI